MGESKVTVAEGLATSNRPERVSRMEFIKSYIAAVLSTEGGNVVAIECGGRGVCIACGSLHTFD